MVSPASACGLSLLILGLDADLYDTLGATEVGDGSAIVRAQLQVGLNDGGVPVPWMPNETDPPAGIEEFQLTPVAVMAPVVPSIWAFHDACSVEEPRSRPTIQPFTGWEPAPTRLR